VCVFSTIKSHCPVFVRLLATRINSKPVLKITKLELNHNHALDAQLYDMLPQNRRLTPEEQADVEVLVCTFSTPER